MFNFKKQKPQDSAADNDAATIRIKGIEIVIVKGEITEYPIGAMVCEANTHMSMEEGHAAIIKAKGGQVVEDTALRLAPSKVGDALITPAGSLPAQSIIHAVTVGLTQKVDESIIRKATYHSLLCAQKNAISSISFPVIGHDSGDVAYEISSKLMAQEIFRYIQAVSDPVIKKIVIVVYSEDVFDVFKNNVCDYLGHLIMQGPFLTVDGIVEYEDGIVLVERTNPPLGWALPGGFVDYGESVESAVAREVKEETNLVFKNIKQFKTYSDKDRDPRFHTVSVVFAGKGEGTVKGDSDAKDARVFKLNDLPKDLAFDHKKIIDEYITAKLGEAI
jgi:ADP-ribose pyrophosphatase YjhB (NUDIX family)/O-acetyl-ADP-ribose deacetylase (regulator of RNase III)